MKVLWLCNIMLPIIAEHLSKPVNSFGGWLTGLSSYLMNQKEVELIVCFPISYQNDLLEGQITNLRYFGFPQKMNEYKYLNKKTSRYLEIILEKVKPDVINIFGTEYSHSLIMVRACEKFGLQDKVVISIQGLVSVYSHHYFASLPNHVVNSVTFRDVLKRDNIKFGFYEMKRRGLLEIEALKSVKNVIGRTTWDKACVSQINSNARYHFCNENLRDEFYRNIWSIENCEKFSIFISQASYPIKGVHYMLMAMPMILERFPTAKLYIAGNDIMNLDSLKNRLKITSYTKYLKDLINHFNLKDSVIFTGILNESEMTKRYINSNVFVCPSSIENSPNSLGEAMLLGVPCIASAVGGVFDMLKHQVEGFVYQTDAPYMLAHYVCEVFNSESLAIMFSKNARSHALLTHDRVKNMKRLIEIYSDIINDV